MSSSDYTCDIDFITETLKHVHNKQQQCALLLGAGCSVSAGIPDANGIVEENKDIYKREYEIAKNNPQNLPFSEYQLFMDALADEERNDLLGEYIRKAKINWTYFAIAHMIKHGYVDRILTTNFDRVLIEACAIVGKLPAIYDLTASEFKSTNDDNYPMIFYLHGQYPGIQMLNRHGEIDTSSARFKSVFDYVGFKRTWIVVGYSGRSDHAMEYLTEPARYGRRLFWVGYKDRPVTLEVKEKIIECGKDGFFLSGYNSDGFFHKVAQGLNCYEDIPLVRTPFTFFKTMVDRIVSSPDPEGKIDYFRETKDNLDKAIKIYEKLEDITPFSGSHPPKLNTQEALALYIEGKFDEIVKRAEGELSLEEMKKIGEPLASSYFELGYQKFQQSKKETDDGVIEKLLLDSCLYFSLTESIQPNNFSALSNWGTSLNELALKKEKDEAIKLFEEAIEKTKKSISINSENAYAWSCWGNSLIGLARLKDDREAEILFKEAIEKHNKAISIDPNNVSALIGLGSSYDGLGRLKFDKESESLFEMAIEKYQKALSIKPEFYLIWTDLGHTYNNLARLKSNTEAMITYKLAIEKYSKATEINPNSAYSWYGWGSVLDGMARITNSTESENLFTEAIEKYKGALSINKKNAYFLIGLGNSLTGLARLKEGSDAEKLFNESIEKYQIAISIKSNAFDAWNNWASSLLMLSRFDHPEFLVLAVEKAKHSESIKHGEGSYNLACICSLQKRFEESEKWLRTCIEYKTLPNRKHLEEDIDLNNVRDLPWFQDILTQAPPP